MSIRTSAVQDIIGKKVEHVIICENDRQPEQQLFLVFSDDTYIEIYGSSFSSGSNVYSGGLVAALHSAHGCGGKVTLLSECVTSEKS